MHQPYPDTHLNKSVLLYEDPCLAGKQELPEGKLGHGVALEHRLHQWK